MTAERKEHATGSSGVLDAEVTRLAAKAISVLIGERGVKRPTIEARLELLGDAFLSDRCDTHRAIVGRMRKEGVSVTDIIDVVLPAVARNAGQRWMDDEISFADVTIVTARLQETVRAFGRVPRGQCPANAPGNPQFAGATTRSADHSADRGTHVRCHSSSPIRCAAWGWRSISPWTCIPARSERKGAENAVQHGRNIRLGAPIPCFGKRIGKDHQGFRHPRDACRAWRKRGRGRS
jgi:hypothetical protein